MNILVVNDDGIKSKGLRALVKSLSDVADVYVCAPDSQRSAAGHGITMGRKIYVHEAEVDGAVRACSISGTPADCTKLGLDLARRIGVKIDIVFSGINHGANLGTDVFYSGTVSATIEGAMKGYPSVAISIDSYEPEHYGCLKELAPVIAKKVYEKRNEKPLYNINLPYLPPEKIKGIKTAMLGIRLYDEVYNYGGREGDSDVFIYSSDPVFLEDRRADIDVGTMREGYIVITPLEVDITDNGRLEDTEKLCLELNNDLK